MEKFNAYLSIVTLTYSCKIQHLAFSAGHNYKKTHVKFQKILKKKVSKVKKRINYAYACMQKSHRH